MRWVNTMSYYYEPEHPFRDALKLLIHTEPPPYVRGYSCTDLTEDECLKLQDWVATYGVFNDCPWTTSIGIIEAAEHIVKCAVENANIPPQGLENPYK